jgi:hypothetical protein
MIMMPYGRCRSSLQLTGTQTSGTPQAEIAGGQQPGQRGQDRPVGPGQPRGLHLTLENGDLVTQDQDLRILGAVGAAEQRKPAEHAQRC